MQDSNRDGGALAADIQDVTRSGSGCLLDLICPSPDAAPLPVHSLSFMLTSGLAGAADFVRGRRSSCAMIGRVRVDINECVMAGLTDRKSVV